MDSDDQDVVKSEDADDFYGIDPIVTGPTTSTRKPVPRDDKAKTNVDKAELLNSVDHSLTRHRSPANSANSDAVEHRL